MLMFHSCTVGSCIFGANTVILPGALLLSCCGGVKKDDGLAEGNGSTCGKPPATVLVMVGGGGAHPLVIVANGNVVVQLCTSPGILPAAAVTRKEEMVSNAIPYPSRITLLPMPPQTLCKQ